MYKKIVFFVFDFLMFHCQGATSIEKIPKISASGRNFLDPLPPSSKKGPTDENVGISYLIVIIKFGFFRVSNPSPPISSESRTSPILSIEVAPKCRINFLDFDFDLKNRQCLSRVTQKYLFPEKILRFSTSNSPLKFFVFQGLCNFTAMFLLIAPSILTQFSSVIPFWKAEGLIFMIM